MRGWIEAQAELQNTVGNTVPMEGAVLSDFVRWNALALQVELAEALHHISWKPWTTDDPWLERDQFVDELVDVFAFLGNMLAAVDCLDDEFDMRLAEKQEIVRQRLLSQSYKQRRIS